MAKTTKKQQMRVVKKQKERADKRRQLRHANRTQIASEASPLDFPSTRANTAEVLLRASIQKFGFQKRFLTEMNTALAHFFGEEAVRKRVLNFDRPEMADFQEWYFFDFVLSPGQSPGRSTDTRLIDLFVAEIGPSLPPEQRQMVDDWVRTNHLRLLEVQEVTPGVGETVRDLLSGELLHCNDISMSRAVRRWQIMLARSLFTQGRWHFTGGGQLLTPMEKDEVVGFAGDLWKDYQREHPAATVGDFYRSHSLQLRKFVSELQERVENPAYLTPEGHAIFSAKAEYDVREPIEVLERLDATEEFICAGDSLEKSGALHYKWLLRGRSIVPAATEQPKHATQLRSEWTLGPGQPSYRSLGDITVTPTSIELACLSRQRLISGRQLLEQVLAGLITHRGDHFADLISQTKRDLVVSPPKSPHQNSEKFQREAPLVENELMARELERWLDTPLPKLNNLSPCQAANSAAGRAELTEILKQMEYLEEGNKQRSNNPFTAQAVRRILGLT